jgi:ParB family transcriptional regulator, chromosome partitioning protein
MPRRTGLGKGLEALIPGGESISEGTGILYIPVDHIEANPRQPRSTLEPEELASLAASIREHGVLQPVLVIPGSQEGNYTLIAGERRWRAAIQAGLDTVPAIVRQANEEQKLEIALIENVQREDLNPLELAEAYRQLNEDFALTHDDIAIRVGKSRVSVTNTLRLLKLCREAQVALEENRISEGHARALLSLPTTQAQAAALQTIVTQDLSVRQTEDLVRRLTGQRPAPQPRPAPPPEIMELEERLRHRLGTRVNLHHGKKGGSLVIHYYSDEELNAIITQILQE